MPKRKKLPQMPDYEGMGKDFENHEIQKARPLQSLSQTDLTLPEFKILDAYLARINSHDNSKRTVRLEKGELEKALGVTRILKDDLNKRLRHLFQIIEVKDDNKRKGFKLINLFEEADAEPDDDGLWQITLTCTPSAREYVFNIDNIGYLRYRLKNVINLTSRYSYVMFLYLLDNRFRKSWSVSLADLKELLNCNADTYKQYKYFNDLVLKKCHKELCEKTDISFEYKPIKRGRSIVAIEFNIINVKEQIENEVLAPDTLGDNGELEGQTSFFDDLPAVDEQAQDYGSDELNRYAEVCEHSFDKAALMMIEVAIKAHKGAPATATERAEWLHECYGALAVEEMSKARNGKKINDRAKYLTEIIKKSTPPAPKDKPSFDLDLWHKQAESLDLDSISFGDNDIKGVKS